MRLSLEHSWTRERRRAKASEWKGRPRASWAWRIIYWLINEDVLHYGSGGSRGRLLSLGTGIIWRPNIYDRVLLLDRLLRPDTARERETYNDVSRSYGDSGTWNFLRNRGYSTSRCRHGPETRGRYSDKGSRLNAKETPLARCWFLPRKIVTVIHFNKS